MIPYCCHILVVLSALWMPATRAMGDAAGVPWGPQKIIITVTNAEKDVAAFHKYLGENKSPWLTHVYNKLVWLTLGQLEIYMRKIDHLAITPDEKNKIRDRVQKAINDINDIKWGNYATPGTKKPEGKPEAKKPEVKPEVKLEVKKAARASRPSRNNRKLRGFGEQYYY